MLVLVLCAALFSSRVVVLTPQPSPVFIPSFHVSSLQLGVPRKVLSALVVRRPSGVAWPALACHN